ncbi:hypothetical protein D9615_004351 [Tricholomella constricta]|uniref:Uncharacterized protein n=1 Tax=Tricholomella constricta TaxID=117010 RepID=A0A8H5HF27_9AGAR|nr:hypothetical protein D9615_004351 [Tricholomella constricta]
MRSAMQNDADGHMAVDQLEEDQDSLFGSPPSSPIRGRSPSPALALPSASDSTQNVGTIALPGSHHRSELPVAPLALSLSNALSELPLRPPAPPINPINPSAQMSSSASPSWSRASSAGPSFKFRQKPSKKTKSKEPTPRPPPPEIPLPDPSGPVPANFLRNQSGLLGTAGLVGGVKPANLSIHRHTRGTNASNPIVVDDEEEQPPILGRQSKFRHPYAKPIDPSLLPTPSTQDVVAMLIGQKDIFPVLESILRLIASGSGPQTSRAATPTPQTSFRKTPQFSSQNSTPTLSSSSLTGPPPKKRKLNRVPAGAADWDVPYPFPPGQGPDSYRTTWERERGKQLISQLVTLIKSAARKAATKIYYQNEQAKQLLESQRAAYAQMQESILSTIVNEPKVHGHYRPSTVTYGLEGEAAAAARAQAHEVLKTDASNGNQKSGGAPAPSPYQPVQLSANGSPASRPQPSTPFDHLISSLLAATPNQNVTSIGSAPTNSVVLPRTTVNAAGTSSANLGIPEVSQTLAVGTSSTGSESMDGLDQGLFDNWMNILQTFPMPSEGFSHSQNHWGILEQPHASTSTPLPTNDDFSFFDFDQTCIVPNHVDPTALDLESIFDTTDTPTASLSTGEPSGSQTQSSLSASNDNVQAIFPQPRLDIAIDPALLAISISQSALSNAASTSNVDSSPSLAASPMPSLSSLGDADPTTPNSATWDLSMPDIFTGAGGDASSADRGFVIGHGYRHGGLAGQGGAEEYLNALLSAHAQGQGQGKEGSAAKVEKGKGRDMVLTAPPRPQLPSIAETEAMRLFTSASAPSLNLIQSTGSAFTSSLPMVALEPAERPLNKADIMRRAAGRKKQLMEEIDYVRTQLWETTIEQGVLSHMSKLCSPSHTT